MENRFCHNCGAQISAGGRFCSSCGTPVLNLQEALEQMNAPAPVLEEEIPEMTPPSVFSLDSLEIPEPVEEPTPEPVAEPEPDPVIFTLDSLFCEPEQPPAQPEEAPVFEPVQEPVFVPAPAAPEMPAQPAWEAPNPGYIPQGPVFQPAPVPTPIPEPEGKPAKRPKGKGILNRRGAVRTIFAVLLCIVIFAWSFATLSLLNVRLATTDEKGIETITAALSTVDVTEVPASALIPGADADLCLGDWILEKIDENYAGKVIADADDLQAFLEDSTLIPFLSERLNAYVNDLYKGNARAALTADDIEDFLLEEADNMEDIFGQEIDEEQAHLIAQSVEDTGMLDALSTRALKSQQPQVFRIINLATSWLAIGILAAVLILLILLLGAIDRSVLRTLSDTGIVLMVASGIWGIAGLFCLVLPGVWSSIFSFIAPLDTVIASLLTSCLIPTAAAFGTGVVLVLIRVIGKAIVSARAAKVA